MGRGGSLSVVWEAVLKPSAWGQTLESTFHFQDSLTVPRSGTCLAYISDYTNFIISSICAEL